MATIRENSISDHRPKTIWTKTNKKAWRHTGRGESVRKVSWEKLKIREWSDILRTCQPGDTHQKGWEEGECNQLGLDSRYTIKCGRGSMRLGREQHKTMVQQKREWNQPNAARDNKLDGEKEHSSREKKSKSWGIKEEICRQEKSWEQQGTDWRGVCESWNSSGGYSW